MKLAFWTRVSLAIRLLTIGASFLASAPAMFADSGGQTTNWDLKKKAAPDECYVSLGGNLPFTTPPCNQGFPKVNQGYVWSLDENTTTGDLWFGTFANPQCITYAGVLPDPNSAKPHQTSSWACEFGLSPYVPNPIPAAALGDFRPPQIFVYNKNSDSLIEVTPPPQSPVYPLLQSTRGIRVAVVMGNLVLMGGPGLAGGINLFAYRADTRTLIGAKNIPQFSNVRKAAEFEGQQYMAVGAPDGTGSVLKLTGALGAPPCLSCFTFEVVGEFAGIGAYISDYDGKLYVSTWPSSSLLSARVYESPTVPVGGLTNADAANWIPVWSSQMYEPDPVTASVYAGGPLMEFDGYLYFSTMHIPWLATLAHIGAFGPPADQEAFQEAVSGTFRATSIFRMKKVGGLPSVELLYGAEELPKFDPFTRTWSLVPNNMPAGKKTPLWGPPGFGNPYNNYSWDMARWEDRLWIGTMDWSFTAKEGADLIADELGFDVPDDLLANVEYGADLWFFPDSGSPAYPESKAGVGNFTSYGIRNMLSSDALFLGMANPMNLLTDPFDQLPEGGWELIKLTPKPSNTPTGSPALVPLGNGVSVEFCNITEAGVTTAETFPYPFLDPGEDFPILDEFLENNPPLPLDAIEPSQLTQISTTAAWQIGCAGALATVCLPIPDGAVDPRIYQLQWIEGSLEWIDVTVSANQGTVCGAVDAPYLGVFTVMDHQKCDVNRNGQIDMIDVQLIFASRNQIAPPKDPRDADVDRVVTVLDGRQCAVKCTYPNCATSAP